MPESWDETILSLSQGKTMKEKSSVVHINTYLLVVYNLGKINGYIYIYTIYTYIFFTTHLFERSKINSQVKLNGDSSADVRKNK